MAISFLFPGKATNPLSKVDLFRECVVPTSSYGPKSLNAQLNRVAMAILLVVVVVSGLTLFPQNAEAAAKPWLCNLEFDARGTDIQILIGYSKISGIGEITCINQLDGETISRRVGVTLGTPIVFPRISFGPSVHVIGSASVPMDSGEPRALLGTYLTVDARLGHSILMLQLLKQNSSFAFDLNLRGVDGFGIAVGGTTIEIN